MFRLAQVAGLQCTVCGNLMDKENQVEVAWTVILFGGGSYRPYEVCCCCLQRVSEGEARDTNYRRKWNTHFQERDLSKLHFRDLVSYSEDPRIPEPWRKIAQRELDDRDGVPRRSRQRVYKTHPLLTIE